MSSFNVGLIFTPEVYTLCQKVEYAGAPRFKYIYIYTTPSQSMFTIKCL